MGLDVSALELGMTNFVTCIDSSNEIAPTAQTRQMDENPYQLLEYACTCLEKKSGRTRKEDCEYSRRGVCAIFVGVEPLAGKRRVVARRRRTRVDWAHEIDTLPSVDYPESAKIILVMDLNTHTLGSLYEALPQPRPGNWPPA